MRLPLQVPLCSSSWHEVAISPAHGTAVRSRRFRLCAKPNFAHLPLFLLIFFPKNRRRRNCRFSVLFIYKVQKSYCIKENSETMLHKSKKLT
ncbi:hypothetical protein EUGRSUZ_A01809 [Eucalyptus grandis]|uniref:Uncharacterized protein n=2 Tax=Eucalyptus grandis TaxID=71139 RepID=A0ACC3M4H3_EUCGR|nr:hypothetical protein EUGRSUZ_A01809 [Eucalyptus grandis]